MTNEPKASKGLDPEMLAAYVDKRLPPDERAAVEAKLAANPESYELLVELIHANEALKDQRPADGEAKEGTEREEPQGRTGAVVPLVPKPKRVRGWMIAGGVLAAAAAVVLVVRLQPDLLQRLRGGDAVDPQLAKLVAAVGEERYIEARLTGGFKYGPLRSVTRGAGDLSQQNLALLAAAGEAQKRAQDEPSVDSLRAWGVAQLLLADFDAAIDTLVTAAELKPPDANLLSDLGAAYLSRYQDRQSGEDLPAAFERVQQALESDPGHLAAAFNRAQILELLGLRDEARGAWQRYLELDGSSEWAVEAARRLETLRSVVTPDPQLEAVVASLGALVPEGMDLQAVRQFAEEELLGRYAGAIVAEPSVAASSLAAARTIAERLGVLQGDTLLREAIAVLEGPDADRSRSVKEGFACYFEARRLHRASKFTDVGPVAARCEQLFRRGAVAFSHWPAIMQARSVQTAGDLAGSEQLSRHVLAAVDGQPYPILRAWAREQLGAVAFLRGDYAAAADSLLIAAGLFKAAGEGEHAAGAIELRGVALTELGSKREAWADLVASLRLLPPRRNSVRWYATRNGVAVAAIGGQFPRTAIEILAGNLSNSIDNDVAVRLAETHRNMARAFGALGEPDDARRSIEAARTNVPRITDQPTARRSQAELLSLEAELVADGSPEQAAALVRQSQAVFLELGIQPRMARLSLFEARAAARVVGPAAVVKVAEEALTTLERQELGFASRRQRMAFRQTTADLYREAMRAEADLGHAERALLSLEQLRRTSLARPSLAQLAEACKLIPSGTTVVSFAHAGDELFRWVVGSGGIQLRRVTITTAALEAMVVEVRAGFLVNSGRRPQPHMRLASALFDDLPSSATAAARWVIVPDASLFRVPFALLPDATGAAVIEGREVVIASSVLGYTRLMGHEESIMAGSATVVAAQNSDRSLPRLPAAAREGERVAALYGVPLLTDDSATSPAVIAALGRSDVLHIAGHALLDARSPWRSHLVLAPSENDPVGALFPTDLDGVRATTKLVVLAGCSTADGSGSQGEGIASLATSFGSAGVRWVVATLWPIPDIHAERVFVDLHQRIAAGATPAAAMRDVQRMGQADGEISARASLVLVSS